MVFEYAGRTRLAAVVGFMDGPNRFPEERVGRAQVRAGGLITGGLIKSLGPHELDETLPEAGQSMLSRFLSRDSRRG